MNQYVTGAMIRELREKNRMTQLQLAEKLGVKMTVYLYKNVKNLN
ncbi:MAG: helix-turn-helix transcriptional regulator [Lachnospiraceae bacterium]|nr:helix-turn-helix transcriptional regulator [Lachnospiraceae bacterium]